MPSACSPQKLEPSSTISSNHSWGCSSTDNCLPLWIQLQEHSYRNNAASVMVGTGYLTSEMVDGLAAAQKDWIIHLSDRQVLDIQSSELEQIVLQPLSIANSMVMDLIAQIPLAAYHPLSIRGVIYQVLMFSSWIGGWGRVRFIVYFNHREPLTVLVANRLDWSPSKILGLYAQASCCWG
jgi:hypothetical protein